MERIIAIVTHSITTVGAIRESPLFFWYVLIGDSFVNVDGKCR